MVLAIDIGNTDIAIGAYLDDKLQFVIRKPRIRKQSSQRYASNG